MRKSVQFEEDLVSVREFELDYEIPIENLWFTADEFCEIKRMARSESREWRKVYGHILKDCYQSPCSDAEDCLVAFCLLEDGAYRRGLERQCNRYHSEQRSDAKDRSRFLVLNMYNRLQSRKVPQNQIEERVSEAYSESCFSAKQFAMRIARADEAAITGKFDAGVADKLSPRMAPQRRRSRRPSGISVQSGNTFDSRLLVRSPLWKSSSSTGGQDDAYAAIA